MAFGKKKKEQRANKRSGGFVKCGYPSKSKVWDGKQKDWVYFTGYCSLERGHSGGHRNG